MLCWYIASFLRNEATTYYFDMLRRFLRTKQQHIYIYDSKHETVLCLLENKIFPVTLPINNITCGLWNGMANM